jgi:hypothetical protein
LIRRLTGELPPNDALGLFDKKPFEHRLRPRRFDLFQRLARKGYAARLHACLGSGLDGVGQLDAAGCLFPAGRDAHRPVLPLVIETLEPIAIFLPFDEVEPIPFLHLEAIG